MPPGSSSNNAVLWDGVEDRQTRQSHHTAAKRGNGAFRPPEKLRNGRSLLIWPKNTIRAG